MENQKMEAAWNLVNPASMVKRYVEAGTLTAEQADKSGITWRDEIIALVLDTELATVGVTIQDVRDAVWFYTATQAIVSREVIATQYGRSLDAGQSGFLVQSPGYRRGPAGP